MFWRLIVPSFQWVKQMSSTMLGITCHLEFLNSRQPCCENIICGIENKLNLECLLCTVHNAL